jgi:hypothetical protein
VPWHRLSSRQQAAGVKAAASRRTPKAAEKAARDSNRDPRSTFSAAPPASLRFRHFSFWLSPLIPANSLRKACGKNRAQSDVQKMRKRRGKSADSLAELLRESGA